MDRREFKSLKKSKHTQLDHSLKKQYGISFKDYREMFLSQAGECAICHTRVAPENARFIIEDCPRDRTMKAPLVVDHCHKTGKVRELLCSNCNTGIGLLKENVEILKSAIAYIERHRPQETTG